jgi:hypothetical protein
MATDRRCTTGLKSRRRGMATMNDPEERRLRDAMTTQAAIERAEAMGTPQGLRSLFPSNMIRIHVRDVRKMKLHPLQRKVLEMTNKQTPKTDATRTDTPTANANEAHRAEQQSAGVRKTADDPAYAPRGPAPRPDTLEGGDILEDGADGEQGEQGTPITDPGPPPERPTYTGTPHTPTVDILTMAALEEDRDAIAAVKTINEPPAVAQYKANLLEWLDTVKGHRAAVEAAKNANAGTNPDADSSGNGVEEA